jgi:hypothetical protein
MRQNSLSTVLWKRSQMPFVSGLGVGIEHGCQIKFWLMQNHAPRASGTVTTGGSLIQLGLELFARGVGLLELRFVDLISVVA